MASSIMAARRGACAGGCVAEDANDGFQHPPARNSLRMASPAQPRWLGAIKPMCNQHARARAHEGVRDSMREGAPTHQGHPMPLRKRLHPRAHARPRAPTTAPPHTHAPPARTISPLRCANASTTAPTEFSGTSTSASSNGSSFLPSRSCRMTCARARHGGQTHTGSRRTHKYTRAGAAKERQGRRLRQQPLHAPLHTRICTRTHAQLPPEEQQPAARTFGGPISNSKPSRRMFSMRMPAGGAYMHSRHVTSCFNEDACKGGTHAQQACCTTRPRGTGPGAGSLIHLPRR